MKYIIECEREADGRWLAEVPELPGVLAYGATAEQATAKAEVLALRVLAALHGIGWRVKRQSGSHSTLSREGWPRNKGPGSFSTCLVVAESWLHRHPASIGSIGR